MGHRKLKKEEGVVVDTVEFVPVSPASFDAFTDARRISAPALSRRVKHLVLVSCQLRGHFRV
jgi:hypothetical protein